MTSAVTSRAGEVERRDGAVICTEGLTKTFPGARQAVSDLDLEVEGGEVFGLLGPNGAGKTTSVGMLTTRVVPTSGRALVAGIDVVTQPALAKQVIGVVPQTNTLDRSLNIGKNLYYHARYFGMSAHDARQASGDALERFRLTGRALATVGSLSGGLAQRVMLARAMLHDPAVIFLDEPSTGLDPQSRLALWEIIDELHGAGQTIVLTTHDMEEADRLCTRVGIMDGGRILALDDPAALKASLGSGPTMSVRAEGDLDALARHLKNVSGVREAARAGTSIRIDLDSAEEAVARIVGAANRGRFTLTGVSLTRTTLETVFIALTGKELRE